ncbi:OPT family oligopeptide transporter [Acinetobacter nectaris]|uniref:OPT family oligopeptide transporter n=1 Tax=Acinetobacter nectaris TaxID=1219382 RepID=UPI001F021501|nr:oligopeptide transporter, OPT family [Acinetobacter nectaris]MCF9047226.1 oligopeptide transporter, OPT family [Acinetobacter nectaris]
MSKPSFINDSYASYKELTLRGVILGIIITIVFTASNIYLGLKVGLTFASSIPAAVLSMALLKFAKGSNILENNLVQTQASAAGTLSSVIFVLPGLLMVGYWQHFPFWQVSLLCLGGGILGVLFTIPLRQIMVVQSDLPYPEGIAAAEILKAGTAGTVANEKGVVQKGKETTHAKEILYGGVLAAVVSFFNSGLRVISDSASLWLKGGHAIFQIPMGFSLALLGAGSLIGMSAGVAILVGIFIAWGIAVPLLSSWTPLPIGAEMTQYAHQLWASKVRFMGVGTIGVASIWTLIMLFKPMIEGVRLSIRVYQQKDENVTYVRTEQDLAPRHIFAIMLGTVFVLFATFYYFIAHAYIAVPMAWLFVILVTFITFIIGFFIAAACGYMAGLVGSSSSPISGIGILSVLVIATVLFGLGHVTHVLSTADGVKFLTALTLFATSAILAIATISNDNLQDLKTGYLVSATPAKQQIALIIGSITGALVIAPVVELLYQAYGFTGAMPRTGMDTAQALAAPQALLMTTISQGIFSKSLDWSSIGLGAVLAVALIVFDFVLKKASKQKLSLPVLAVGMGIYLPPSVNMPLFIGAFIFWAMQKYIAKSKGLDAVKRIEQKGTLFAAGLIVGESLMGVILAVIIVVSVSTGGSDSPLAIHIPASWQSLQDILGFVSFAVVSFIFIKRSLKP